MMHIHDPLKPVKLDLWVIDGVEYDGESGYFKYIEDNNIKHVIDYTHYGIEEFFENNERHRIGGPAVIRPDVDIYDYNELEEYWLYGKTYKVADYWKELYNRGIISLEEAFLKVL